VILAIVETTYMGVSLFSKDFLNHHLSIIKTVILTIVETTYMGVSMFSVS